MDQRDGGGSEASSLNIEYSEHERVDETIDIVRYCLESLSIGFDGWERDHVKGPGFYLVIVAGSSVDQYADPMGTNRWPVDVCPNVFGDIDRLHAAISDVAAENDGAVIASIDGVVQRQMVRIKDLSREELRAKAGGPLAYEDWMGSRHMNALDTSVREDVVAAVTLSEENGRVTVFEDGDFEDYERGELGGRWRVGSSSPVATSRECGGVANRNEATTRAESE